MFIRTAAMEDHAAVLELANKAGFGMTSLPPDPAVLEAKIAHSIASFKGEVEAGHEAYFFVLEDPVKHTIAGTCGIVAHVGLTQPFYSYKLTTLTQTSRELNIFNKHTILQVCNDLTGATEVGSLFLLPQYRRDGMGKLLSFCRFMFIAAFPERVDRQVIAEMRGVHDSEGNAPFYNSIARHFFQMPFSKADYTNATQGNQFINDLIPKYPIYVSLLPKPAQRVIGQPNPASEPAKAMLESQGFRYQHYVDVFDGGPTLIAERDQLGLVRESRKAVVSAIDDMTPPPKWLLANDRYADYRCLVARMALQGDGTVHISPRAAEQLQVVTGDTVRYAPF